MNETKKQNQQEHSQHDSKCGNVAERALEPKGEGIAKQLADPSVIPSEPLQNRTTGGQRHCRRCGHPVAARRRNGYCSDRCRMADRRQTDADRRRKLFSDLRETLAALEQELAGTSSGTGGER